MVYHFINKFPTKGSHTVVRVEDIDKYGINVLLLEYDNIKGKIFFNEVVKSNLTFIKNKYKIGTSIICLVIEVEEENDFISLSNKHILEKDATLTQINFNNNKKIINLVNGFLLQDRNNFTYNDFMLRTLWKIELVTEDKVSNYLDIIKHLVDYEIFDLDENIRYDFIEYIRKNIFDKVYTIKSVFSLMCKNYGGIETIKKILIKCRKLNTSDEEININVIKLPEFVIYSESKNKDLIMELINEIIDNIRNESIEEECEFILIKEPHILLN
jgi:translation initiation factor 2 alpha subunit (eIF-2alpha)